MNKNKTTADLAQAYLGQLLVHHTPSGIFGGWIVETEAYVGVSDQACHSYGGKRTPRIEAMYDKPGTIYTYQMHTHTLFNIVCQEAGTPEAVLVRAVEPAIGLDQMLKNRARGSYELTNGPGKLTQAMAIGMELNGTSIFDGDLSIDFSQYKVPKEIEVSARIGIANKGEWTHAPLRYSVKGNPYVSKAKKSDMDLINFGWKSE